MRRSGKFYFKNEKEVMKSLGLKQTKGSGNQWLEKEDGQNDFLICQLKSTDAASIRIQQKDIRTLEYNADVSHKLPIFAIQFLNTGEVWLMAKPEDFTEVAEYINTGKVKRRNDIICCVEERDIDYTIPQKIKSSLRAREEYKKEQIKKYDKTKSAK
jgi:hypothetical protein